MRGFIIFCLVSVALAAPQGYSYGGGHHQAHHQYGSDLGSTATFLKDLQAVMAVQSSAHIEHQYAGESHGDSGSEHYGSTGSSQHQLSSHQPRYLAPAVAAANSVHEHGKYAEHSEALVSKNFYIHSAPEEEEDEVQHRALTIGKARKNYNVVFIKAPAKPAPKTSIKIIPAVNEEKTVIYVLAKKNEGHEIDAQVHEPHTTTAKPEVFFIKYKTAEEAEHAQHTIQAQYDHLGGSTHISNEGIAPVSSVIGTLDAINHATAAAEAGHSETEEDHAQYTHHQQQQESAGEAHQQQQQQSYHSHSQHTQMTNNGYLPPTKYYHH